MPRVGLQTRQRDEERFCKSESRPKRLSRSIERRHHAWREKEVERVSFISLATRAEVVDAPLECEIVCRTCNVPHSLSEYNYPGWRHNRIYLRFQAEEVRS